MVNFLKSLTPHLPFTLPTTKHRSYNNFHSFKLAVDSATNHIIITDPDGVITYANKGVTQTTGYSPQEIIGATPQLWGQQMPKEFYQKMWHRIKVEHKVFSGEIINKRKNGQIYYAKSTVSPIIDDKSHKLLGFVGIEYDITKEKEVDRLKTEFISLASHQLRTPLSAMKWFLELLLAGDIGKLTKEQKEIISNIDESNERMISLVNNLLNISRIESGRLIIEPQPTNINELIKTIIKEITPLVKTKHLNLVTSVHPKIPIMNIDPKLISEVYKNLISNAIKYSPEDSEITLIVSVKNKQLISQINDYGVGIPKEEQPKVFDKFFRATNVIKLETEGTGLGLYLTKAILDNSNGKIWFESQETKGTTFWFSLPINKVIKKTGEVHLTPQSERIKPLNNHAKQNL